MPACTNQVHEAFAQAYVNNGYNRALAIKEITSRGVGARSMAHYYHHHPEVRARIQELTAQIHAAGHINAQRVMQELGRLSFGDVRDLYDDEGNLIPPHLWSADVAARVASIDVETKWEGRGDEAVPVTVRKIRFYDKVAPLTLLAKHFKLVGEEGDGVNALASALADRLRSARRRRHVEPQDDVVDAEDLADRPLQPEPLQALEAVPSHEPGLPATIDDAPTQATPEEPLW